MCVVEPLACLFDDRQRLVDLPPERVTVIQIGLYAILTAIVSLLRLMQGLVGYWYVGVAIVLISSEMEEILRLSDRVVVMRRGRVAATLSHGEANENSIMRAAALAGESA